MQMNLNLLLVCIMMVGQFTAAFCDFHNDYSHSEDSVGLHWESIADPHHQDCSSPAEAVARLSSGNGTKFNLLLKTEALFGSPASMIVQADRAAISINDLPDRSVPFPPRALSRILRI